MKFSKLDLLTLLISLFILNSCKNQDTIGLGVNTSTQLNGNLIDTSTIVINTIPEDSVFTENLVKTPMGLFRDPVLGTTEANLAVDLNLPSFSAYTIPTGTITIDSALLVLRFSPGFYGDSLASRYKINAYQLAERIYSNASYYNTKQWKYNTTLLGTKSFFSRTHDSIGITAIIAGGVDTIQKVRAQIRIPIDRNFVNNILFNASATQLASNLIFKNNVNGFFLSLDKTGTTGAGGIFMMADTTTLDVYYKTFDGSTTDTTMVSLPSTLSASQIKHTYSAAVQTELNNQTTGSRNTFYLQGPAGLRAKISFPYIKNIIKSLGSDIVLNRAELVITPAPGSIIPFAPLPKITMYRYDLAGQREEIQDGVPDPRSTGLAAFGGYYTTAGAGYHFILTAYISDLMRGLTTDYGTFLGAVDAGSTTATTQVDIAATPQVAGRTFAIGTDKTSPYRIKLNIIYTKIAK